MDAAPRRGIGPWYRAAPDQDREARAASVELLDARSEPASEVNRAGPAPLPVVDPKAFVRSVFRDGLLPALRTDITVVRADTISLRTTRDGVPFLAYSNETVTFGFRNVMKPRLSTIVGLDATEDGEVIDLQTLLDLQGADESKHVAGLFEARQNPGTTSAADL